MVENKLITTSCMHITHALMGHWLADVHLAGFAPAFTLSFHDSECSRKPPNAYSLGREKKEKVKQVIKISKERKT